MPLPRYKDKGTTKIDNMLSETSSDLRLATRVASVKAVRAVREVEYFIVIELRGSDERGSKPVT